MCDAVNYICMRLYSWWQAASIKSKAVNTSACKLSFSKYKAFSNKLDISADIYIVSTFVANGNFRIE